jgi:hypothetical protein
MKSIRAEARRVRPKNGPLAQAFFAIRERICGGLTHYLVGEAVANQPGRSKRRGNRPGLIFLRPFSRARNQEGITRRGVLPSQETQRLKTFHPAHGEPA